MTRKEKQKAMIALKISTPVMTVTQGEFNDYIQTLNKIMDWLEQEPILDKIRTEIVDTGAHEQEVHGKTEFLEGINYCLNVIDKYTAENTSNCDSCKNRNEIDGSNCHECVKGIRNNYKADSEKECQI